MLTCLSCEQFSDCTTLFALVKTESIRDSEEAVNVYEFCAGLCDSYTIYEELFFGQGGA